MDILLCTNGAPANRPAITYGVSLAGWLGADVTLLGVVERPADRSDVEAALDEASALLAKGGISHGRALREGDFAGAISAQASEGDYLVVLGPFARAARGRRIRLADINRVLERVASPLVYVPQARDRLESILLCLGGLGRAANMVSVAAQLALATRARVTLLHVLEPARYDYPAVVQGAAESDALLATDTPQARHLGAALDELREAGLEATLRVREGYPNQQIVEEARAGDYDLLGLGSHYSASGLRPFVAPNVTGRVAQAAHRPLLVVR